MASELRRLQQVVYLLNLLVVLASLFFAGCVPAFNMEDVKPIQIKKPNGDLVWSKLVLIDRGEKSFYFAVQSPNLKKILNPEEPSLSNIPIDLVPAGVSLFGKWKTPDGSKFILTSSVQYDKNKGAFLLENPILFTSDGSEFFLLTATLSNGEHITVKVRNGEEIKNNPRIGINGEIKP